MADTEMRTTATRRRRQPLRAGMGAPVDPAEALAEEGIGTTELDGVRVCWIDHPGPKRALLQFRVGVTDEAFTDRGISHLVEHLALSTFAGINEMYNGFVDLGRTAFLTEGSESHVVDFLGRLGHRIHDLPLDRLERERRILRTEAQHRQTGAIEDLLVTRFGARGYGLAAYREWGLETLSADAIAAWAASRFTAGNAVLWLTFPPPDALRLDLPGGARRPLPAPTPRQHTFPLAHRWGALGGFSWLSERSPESAMAEFALARRLEARLRHDAGTTYSVASDLQDVGPGRTMHTVLVDAADGSHQPVADTVHAVVEEMAADGHGESDVEAWRHHLEQGSLHADSPVGVLDAMARRMLFDQPIVAARRWSAAVADVPASDVARELGRGLASGVFVIPHGSNPSGGLPLLRPPAGRPVQGRSWSRAAHSSDDDLSASLRIGDDGVSTVVGSDVTTVRWEDLVALLRWADGGRALVSGDSTEVTVVPDRWDDGRSAVEAVDRRAAQVPTLDVGRRIAAPQRSALEGPPVRPWRARAATLVGRRPHTGLATWDSAEAHWSNRFPADAPSTGGYQITALTLAWLVREGLVSDWFVEESGELLERLRFRSMTPVELAVEWDGTLATDMATPRGNAFLRSFLVPRRGSKPAPISQALDALCRRFSVSSVYHLPDTWEVFDAFSEHIGRHYRSWSQRAGRLHG